MHLDISVTNFKRRCLEIGRLVERAGQPISVTRRGKVVAHLAPSQEHPAARRPWEALRELGGEMLAGPSESALRDEDFEALR